jgi:putative ABC transport system substrate-binding protein
MRRRTFLAGLGAAAWAHHARARPRVPRIGYLGLAPADPEKPLFEAFEAGLRELGYVPGETIEIEFRAGDGRGEDWLAELARELVALEVEIIVTGGPGVIAARKVTDAVPIVMLTFGDIDELIALGIVARSLAHPGGTVTGETFFIGELFLKRVEFLKQVKPAMKTVGALVLRGSSLNPVGIPVLHAKVEALGLALEPIEVAEPANYDLALSAGPGASIGALMVTDMPQFVLGSGPAAIAAAALRHGLPAAGPASIAKSGGLLGYGVDTLPMFRRAATFVDKILKGAKPGDIPIEQATKFETVVNLKTAKALGLEIPPTLLAAADEVIE